MVQDHEDDDDLNASGASINDAAVDDGGHNRDENDGERDNGNEDEETITWSAEDVARARQSLFECTANREVSSALMIAYQLAHFAPLPTDSDDSDAWFINPDPYDRKRDPTIYHVAVGTGIPGFFSDFLPSPGTPQHAAMLRHSDGLLLVGAQVSEPTTVETLLQELTPTPVAEGSHVVPDADATEHAFIQVIRIAMYSSDVVKLLLDHGAQVNAFYGSEGITPLHQVMRVWPMDDKSVPLEVATMLLDAGADLDVLSRCRSPHPPLFEAIQTKWVEGVQLLLQRGADISVPSGTDRDSPLHAAVASGCVAIARLLVEAGADVNARNAHGKSPLFSIIALNESPELDAMVRLLHEAGGDFKAPKQSSDDESPVTTVLEEARAQQATNVVDALTAIVIGSSGSRSEEKCSDKRQRTS